MNGSLYYIEGNNNGKYEMAAMPLANDICMVRTFLFAMLGVTFSNQLFFRREFML